MKLVEIRDLDGPNLFMLEPAIKVEIQLENCEAEREIARRLDSDYSDLRAAAQSFLARAGHESAVVTRQMDRPGHVSIAFSWRRRTAALDAAEQVAAAILDVVDDNIPGSIADSTVSGGVADAPECLPDSQRSAIAIAVTGTNGKTTTTRLIAHLMQSAGYRTGWNSSSGVYIDGETIEEGDYSGPSGARRILDDPSVQAAVLETARGGILLRGLGYEHNDVSVFTNVSADHLGLQGVLTLETMAEVKAVVCKVTRPGGSAVVNADDPLVMAATDAIAAPRTLVTQRPDNPLVAEHLAAGGTAILADEAEIVARHGDSVVARYALDEIPMTHAGRARHMVENAMCAIGAALGAGLGPAQIRSGLRTFRNDAAGNLGRLNMYRSNGVTLVLDFAHNEAGITHLVDFGRKSLTGDGRLISIIGTAGDRTEESLMAIGRIAAEGSDIVIAHGTVKYLRGRSLDELLGLYRSGANLHPETEYLESETELTGLEDALKLARPGDVIVMMAHEFLPQLTARLKEIADPD
jgi:cyanophycin synthetase